MFKTLGNLDLFILVSYFALVFLLAWRVTVRERRAKAGDYGSSDYFLGGKSLGWFVIGASLFASNIGSEHLVGLSGAGAKGAMPAAQFEILAALILVLLGWVFVPFYLRSGVFTMPEFLERRYSRGARNYLSIVSILAYILTKISVTIFAGALVFEVLGVPFWAGAVLVVVGTGVYTIFGGLRAVVYTDMLQMFVFLGSSALIVWLGLEALGGWEGLTQAIQEADPANHANYFSLWRSGDDTHYPWTGIIFGAPILGIWYWCTDQFIVQRVLSAKDISTARRGALFGGFLKLTPLFLFILPGIIAFALAHKGFIDLGGNPDSALPALIIDFLPVGVKGLVLAGLLAALMSSLSSVFNSCATLITIDFYKRFKPEASERELVWTGQISTGVLVLLSLGWIPAMRVMMEDKSFYEYLQSIQAYISPPIAAAFLVGLFVKRINGRGAIWALWSGFALGMGRLVLEYAVKKDWVQLDGIPLVNSLVSMNFLHFAIVLFVISILVLWVASLTAPPLSAEKLMHVTWEKGQSGPLNRLDIGLTILLIALVGVIWLIFR